MIRSVVAVCAVLVFVAAVSAPVAPIGVAAAMGPTADASTASSGFTTNPAVDSPSLSTTSGTESTVYGSDTTRQHATHANAFEAVSSQQFDETTFEITVHENGSATWTFRHERLLENVSEESSFESFAEQFEAEETELYTRFVDQAEALTDTGADQTDRDMAATNFNRTATVEYRPDIPDDAVGVVEMTFTWTEFANVDDETGAVTVGDVFRGGLYIGPDQSLVVKPGEDLVFSSVTPEADGEYTTQSLEEATSIEWDGEHEFPADQPTIVFEHRSTVDDPVAANGDQSPVLGDISLWALLAVLAVIGLGIAGGFGWYRRHAGGNRDGAGAGVRKKLGFGSETGFGLGGSDRSTDDADGGGSTTAASDSAGTSGTELTEADFLTDEDRVVSIIEQNGGRMKQVDIVDETGWSKSKVSMLLSEMEEDGTISKLRVGRENIISLEGFEPEATKSPFEK